MIQNTFITCTIQREAKGFSIQVVVYGGFILIFTRKMENAGPFSQLNSKRIHSIVNVTKNNNNIQELTFIIEFK